MNSPSQVQILDGAVYVLLRINSLEKGMNRSIPSSQGMDKIIGHTGLSNIGKAIKEKVRF